MGNPKRVTFIATKIKPLTVVGSVVVYCIVIVLLLGLLHFICGAVTSPDSIIVYDIKVEDTELQIRGDNINSSSGFVSHKYKIENEILCLQLRYRSLTTKNQYGDFNIKITDNFADVNKVYLLGKKSDTAKAIWAR